jgi:Ser/Thr protein kinase RdoA (MazF antagonist)
MLSTRRGTRKLDVVEWLEGLWLDRRGAQEPHRAFLRSR